jgi:hypothetical protein
MFIYFKVNDHVYCYENVVLSLTVLNTVTDYYYWISGPRPSSSVLKGIQRTGNWICLFPQLEGWGQTQIQFPLRFVVLRIPDNGQSPDTQ